MAKTTAPLLSWGASGQIAETQVYSRWKGRPYVRRYVIPSNPKTAPQTLTRNAFRTLQAIWPFLPASAVAAWELYGVNQRYAGRNGWTHVNLPLIRGQMTIEDLVISIAANGGITPGAVTITPGVGQATVQITAPTLPTGWTITTAAAAAIEAIAPDSTALPQIVSATQASPPYDMTLAGLTAGKDYVVGGWLAYQKPDGTAAYAQSVQQVVTPS